MPSSASAETGSGGERRCLYCRQPFVPSVYRRQQSVCGLPDCQKRRESDYHRNKRLHDPAYAQTCQNSQENWLRDHPDYTRQYRQTHPKAVERNREGGRQRYRYRQLANLAKNNLASSQIYIVQQLTSSEAALGIPCKEHPASFQC